MRILFLCVSFLMGSCLTQQTYASLSDLDIVVKETVIGVQPVHPTLKTPLDFDHIVDLEFVYNYKPSSCLSMIRGVIIEPETSVPDVVMLFVICITEDDSKILKGEMVELITF